MRATVVVDNIGNDELKANGDFVSILSIRVRKYCWMLERRDFSVKMRER